MSLAILVTPIAKTVPTIEGATYIGVDAGSLKIIEKKLPLAYAVGDFDSMDAKALETLKTQSQCIIHPVQKDETDSELAIELAMQLGCDPIVLWGALGKRIDHAIANMRLLMYRFPNLILQDETQKIIRLDAGRHIIQNEYTHCSFFAIQSSTISLDGFLYPVDHRTIHCSDIYTVSNSIQEEQAMVEVHEGSILCILSNEK